MRIYLDYAATSYPKRPGVVEAMDHYSRECGAPVGRGAYRQAVELQRTVERCRRLAAETFRASAPDRILFTFNGTDSLNLVILGLCRPGDHVVTSLLEHNSVLRPLRHLVNHRQVEVTWLEPRHDGRIDPADLRRNLRPNTRLVVLTHASNVTGTIQPVVEVGDVLRGSSAMFLLDAAQTAGHVPIDLVSWNVDFLATSGHKGLGGPLGTGLLYVRPGREADLIPLRFGGTGSHSEQDEQPAELPDRYESGNHNAPGLVGLTAALEQLAAADREAERQRELTLTGQLIEGLRSIPRVSVHVPGPLERQVGVVSISTPDVDPQTLAVLLDQEFQVQTRAGLHCAPKTHAWLGTLPSGGTVRLSLGYGTTASDIATAVDAVRAILRG